MPATPTSVASLYAPGSPPHQGLGTGCSTLLLDIRAHSSPSSDLCSDVAFSTKLSLTILFKSTLLSSLPNHSFPLYSVYHLICYSFLFLGLLSVPSNICTDGIVGVSRKNRAFRERSQHMCAMAWPLEEACSGKGRLSVATWEVWGR